MAGAHARLRELGIELPKPPSPLASYVPTRTVPIGNGRALLYIAGQVPIRDGAAVYSGRVPDQVAADQAREAARICALNLLAQIDQAAGLDAVEQVAELTGYVLSAEGFAEQPSIVNAASDLLADVLGDAGRHARAAIGVNALPMSAPVEISAVVVVFRAG
jgi:enamine deaminase RidA (YjgF/YER057c/UK114 family)